MNASSAEPGRPIVERPGPSFPAAIANSTFGCVRQKESTIESIAARPSSSFPIPNDMFITSGRRRCSANRAAYSIARSIEPFVVTPPRALLAILRPMTRAPGATPSKPPTP